MKKIACILILLGFVSAHPASAGNKKNNAAKAARSGSGGGGFHVGGGGGGGHNFSQRSFRGNSMHGSNTFHGNNAFHSQGNRGFNASRGLHAQHGLNSNNHAFRGQHGLSAQHGLHGQNFHSQHGFNAAHGNFHGKAFSNHGNARLGLHNGNYSGHWRSAGHFRSYHDAFRGYHRSYHDHYWWHSHYNRIVVVGGGPYYWSEGYWYPAWGYDPGYTDYVYDGPIYSYDNLPPDQVIVNVQEALQDQGYYTGEVDGQLGPKTRDAIASYQQDHDLEVTSAVDEPTVQSLGLG